MDMVQDFIRERGYLTLGSRLKRLGERMQTDVQRLAKNEGIDVPSGFFPTVGALDRHGALTVGELAQALGISQPGATRNVRELTKLGLVKPTARPGDRRVRAVQMTGKCKRMFRETKIDLWPRVEKAVATLCADLEGNLLSQLSQIEAALEGAPLDVRAAKKPGKSL